MFAPFRTPLGFVIALHHKHELLEILRNTFQPGIELRAEMAFVRRQQFDDRTQRPLRAQNRAVILAGRIAETSAVISLDQLGNLVKIIFEISNKNRSGQDRVGNGLGNFRLAAAGNRAGFVAQDTFRDRAHQPPTAVRAGLFHPHFIARRTDVNFSGKQFDGVAGLSAGPGNLLLVQIEPRVLRHVNDVRIFFVHRETLRLQFD